MNVSETTLGALLHDIGKFSQRASLGNMGLSPQSIGITPMICPTGQHGHPTHRHVLYTNEFMETLPFLPNGLDRSRVANLASFHHRPDTPDQWIIARADRLSSGMERYDHDDGPTPSSTAFRRTRLQAVASTIALPETGPIRPVPLALAEMEPGQAFPLAKADGEDLTSQYHALWERFVTAWAANQCPAAPDFINRSISILERFTWCIPSATNAVPDISLFDHLKTTAAIAACLCQAGEGAAEPFLLVAGDLTGIQQYIFGIRQGSGGLARRLRARSFKVAAYLESISLTLLSRLGLSLAQRILFAGGKFHLLLPNTVETREQLAAVERSVSQWLFAMSSGEMGLALASLSFPESGLADFAQTVTQLNAQLREARNRAGESVLIENGAWVEDGFVLPELRLAEQERLCECCQKQKAVGRESARGEPAICPDCLAEEQIGRWLPATRYVGFFAAPENHHSTPLGGIELLGEKSAPFDHPLLILDLDGVGDGPKVQPIYGAYRSRHVPRDPKSGNVVMFEELAARSQGRRALGYLKIDVDNLGYLFSQGFRCSPPSATSSDAAHSDGEDRTSISRVAAFSRTLEVFFAGYLESLLRREFPDVYLVFSGGDDIAAVGPWTQMFDLAFRVREEFRRFTSNNPAFTLSAGIAVTQVRTPVLVAMEEADSLLDASKTVRGAGVVPWPSVGTPHDAPRKDRLTAFGTSIPWADYGEVLKLAKQMLAWLQEGTLRTAQVRRLLVYAEMDRQFQRTRDTKYLQYVPHLVREIRRNWREETDAQRAARRWAARLATPDSREMGVVPFLCHYALYGNRSASSED